MRGRHRGGHWPTRVVYGRDSRYRTQVPGTGIQGKRPSGRPQHHGPFDELRHVHPRAHGQGAHAAALDQARRGDAVTAGRLEIVRKYNSTPHDYFLAGKKIPWWVAMFSIVATETSVLTFVSIPGLAYRENWIFLQLAMGYIFGRILVAIFLLPQYFNGNINSIYEVIGSRFGTIFQKIASATFLITRLFADVVRFLATAVIVQMITNWPIWIAVLIIGCFTMIYTLSGGIRTVIWIDSFQFIFH